MTIELEEKLAQEFDFMKNKHEAFRYNYEDKDAPIPCECDDGWFQIIYDLCKGIQDVLNESETLIIKVCQIKEKFGTLRFYYSLCEYNSDSEKDREASNKIEQLIREAENRSEVTCEWCGKQGKLRRDGWLICLCDECNGEREK